MEDNDAQTQLKKRARRRLVGAVFFVSVVALVLPMIMDHDPRPPVQDVEISIPGQDDKAFAPRFAAAPQEGPAEKLPVEAAPTARPAEAVPARSVDPERDMPFKAVPVEKPAIEKVPPAKPQPKPVEKTVKPAEKPESTPPKPVINDDAKRAAAILAGQVIAPAPAVAAGEHLVLIGAFSNSANVVTIRKKLGEQGIKTFTEPLDTPQGKKIRVRAGPFPSRDAAEKALDKMKRIGVSGVVAAK
jgi:DedD protein